MILELETQFQLSIVSVVFSMIATNVYTFIEIIFKRLTIIKCMANILFFVIFSVLYYAIIYFISGGILSIYLIFFLILGYYLHMRFYDKYFSCWYDYLFLKISSIINNVKGRCSKRWKERKFKKMRKKENLTEQSPT